MIEREKIIAIAGLTTVIVFISAAVMGTATQTAIVKHAPSVVSLDTSSLAPKLAEAEMEAAWRLFDGDTETAYTPSQTAKITITYPEARAVSRIRVYGPSAYHLNLYRDNKGVWEAVPSLSGADLSALEPTWSTFTATESFSTANLLLEFTPMAGMTDGIREIEIWGPENSIGHESSSHLSLNNIATPQDALDITAKEPSHILEFSATPSELSVSEGTTPQVSIGITQNPVLFKRAYILYDGYNMVRSVSIQRRINGLSWSGGFSLPRTEDAEPSWSSYIEEINPAWLVQGENRIEFQVPEGSAAIRGLTLIAETGSGWNYISSVSSSEAYDDDTGTSYTIAASSVNPTLDITFEREVQPETVKFRVSGQMSVAAGLQYQSGTTWQDVQTGWQVDFSSMQSGWNEIAIPAAISTKALRLTFNTAGKRIKPGVQIGKIDEIRVSASPLGSPSGDPRIVIAYPRDGEYFNRTAYVQGFAVPTSNDSGAVQIGIEGKSSVNTDGSFSLSLSKDETSFFEQADDDAWAVAITSQYGGQTGAGVTLTLNKNSGSAKSTEPKSENRGNAPFSDNRDRHTERVTPGQAKKIEYKGVTLDIPAGAVDKDTDVTITPLTEADLAHYNPGMINVTYPDAGYRFEPHNMKFKKAIKISFGYSKSLFASGQADNDVNMYYYDESLLKWQQLTRVKVDSASGKVTSESDHFTDIISSTLVVPEHAQALSFNPNSIKDIKAADPSANVNLIEPPRANNKGTANLNYPIDLPPGRNKLQPNIAVQYNSSGGNGWTGLGWDIPLQAISIDTRWGVPRYSATQETETYMLDGEQLAPLAHRSELQPRTPEKAFHTRVEGQFRKIVRHGTAPANYWWEAIDKNGTKYFYGGKPDSFNIPNSEATLADPSTGNIFKWALRRIQDTNGNTVNYTYTLAENTGIAGGTVMGYQLYASSIDYTGYNDQAGAYSVVFKRDRDLSNFTQRPDVAIDARSGFKMVTADLLKRIEVTYKDQTGQIHAVRSYAFDYVTGAFEKTLLSKVTQYGSNGAYFNKHEFSYYDAVSQGNGSYNGFNSSATWDTRSDNISKDFAGVVTVSASALGGTEATNSGEMLYVGFAAATPTKNISIGGKAGTSSSDTTGLITMVDINGDSLPDKVYKCGDGVCYRLNTSGPNADLAHVSFSSDAGRISGISEISRDHSDQTSGGAQGFVGAGSAIYDDSTTITTQSAYFTDANGDGLTDLVDNGAVYFNTGKLDSNGNLFFSTNSYDTPVPIGQGSVNASGMIPDYSDLYDQMSEENPLLDSVRRWVAPYDGTIKISGAAQLVNTSQERASNNYTTADGVRAAIQKEGTELWYATTSTPTDYSFLQPVGTDSIEVSRGERIYFRVQSRSDGSYDQVNWNPVIEYTGVETSRTDVNSRPVYKFTAGDDLILGGREFSITMPYRGTLRITGDLSKKGVTTDDVAVTITLNDAEIRRSALTWDQTGTMTASGSDIAVQKDDVLKLKILTDSNIDLKQLEWDAGNKPQVFYVEAYYPDTTPLDENGNPAEDSNGNPVGPAPGSAVTVKDNEGNYIVQLEPLYDMEFYPENSLTAPQESWTASETGTVLVTPYISVRADGTVFTVKRRTALLGKSVMTSSGDSGSEAAKHSFEVPVNAGEELFFDFSSRDPELAGKAVGVAATHHYITPQSTTNVNDIGISLDGSTGQKKWSNNQGGTATITPLLSPPTGSVFNFDSSVTLNVVSYHGIYPTTYYSRTIPIQKGLAVDPKLYAFDINVSAGYSVILYYTTTDSSLIGRPIKSGAQIRYLGEIAVYEAPSALHQNIVPTVFSKPYRGWGYIAYNGNGDRAAQPINQSLLTASSSESDYNPDSSLPTEDTKDSYTAIQDYYVPMPNIALERWTSVDEQWWIAAEQMSSTRMGLKYISVPTSDKYSGTTAPSRLTENSQSSYGAGYYVAYSDADAPSKTVLDYMDLNGDRYPDVIGQGVAQYTDMLGALESDGKDLTQSIGAAAVRDNQTDSDTIGPGGTAPDVSKWGKKPPQGQQSQNPSYGLSGSLGMGTSYTKCDMMDVNGDGLPDRVCDNSGTISVQLNLGYDFAKSENWGSAKLSNGSSTNLTLSPSLSYTDGVKGFSGGVSVAGAETTNEAALVDVNGDGLLDRVYNSGNDIYVGFNKGAGFANPGKWEGSLGHRLNEGLNASYFSGVSYYYPIGPLCLVACYIIINPETNYGESVTREESALRDVNGDGYADHLFSDSDGSLQVAVNRTENTNLLKIIKRPMGGSIEIKYTRHGNTYDMPQSQWSMTEVTVSDGMKRKYRTTYAYSDGYQDRYERDFYGFRTVTETQAPDTSVARKLVQTYYNSDYYRKGLLQKTVTRDAKTNTGYVWSRTENSYEATAVKDEKGNALSDTYFPALAQTTTSFYNGKNADEDGRSKYTYQTFAYDNYGNVTTFTDIGELSDNADDVAATITYYIDLNSYIIKPETILVEHGSTMLRKRVATYDNKGNLLTLKLHNTRSPESVWTMEYDSAGYGNITAITDPVGYKLTYTYDTEVHTYVTKIKDNFSTGDGGPYYSSASYNLLFGQVSTSVDLNNNTEARGYDYFGRLTCVYGPYDTAPINPDDCTGTPTIAFAYTAPAINSSDNENLNEPARAETTNRAVSSKGGDPIKIKTITYADGMKRILETKKDADVNGAYGTVVSGMVSYDELGRITQQGQPRFESGYNTAFTPQPVLRNPTLFSYDALDRTTMVVAPDGATTTTAYDFDKVNKSGILYAMTTVVDPEGNKPGSGSGRGTRISYKDVDDRIVAVVEYNKTKPYTMTYGYNPLGEITSVKDNKGNTTYVEYDEVGNRLSINNPDSGKTTYNYDANGNILSKQTANSHKITYNYVYNRLKGIDYPNSLKTASVAYEYGKMLETYNRAGRIKKVTDESGVEERQYGRLGEITREEKTVEAKTPAVQKKKYSTDYVFDSFGRMTEMTYPDGETLRYAYDNGGLLKAAWGEKSGNRYDYITSLLYDEFGQRTSITYGNGTKTTYAYNDQTRRLAALITTLKDGRQIQNLTYDYDLVGNINELLNDIKVPTSTALPAGRVKQKYAYDDLYQITDAQGWYDFGPGKENKYHNTFEYDTIGNFTKKSLENKIIQPSASETLPKETNYVLNYQYLTGGSARPHAVTETDDKKYTYDNNGNMTGWTSKTNGTKRTIVWSEENRVKQIEDNGKTTYFLYDDAGERVVKRGEHGETIYVNRFYSIRSGELGTKHVFAGETRVVSKLVKTPNTTTTNSSKTALSTTTTIPGEGGLDHGRGKKRGIIRRLPDGYNTGVNQPVEKDLFYFHGDHLGSSNMITDNDGAVYQHIEYFPYGETWIEEGGTYGGNTPGYKFTGKELDPETGLYYYGARYYDPVLSRWISADPILGKYLPNADKESNDALAGNGGVYNPVNLSLYAYAHQNPVKLMDPDGKDVLVPVAARLSNKNDISYWRAQQDPYTVYEYNVYDYNTPQEYIAAERAGTLTDPIGSVELSFDARMKGDNKGTILGAEGKWAEMQNRHTQYGEKTKHAISITDVGKGKEDIFTTKKGSSLINKLLNKIGLGTPEAGDVRKNIRAHAGGPYGSKGCATSCDPAMSKAGFEAELGEQIPSLGSKDEKTFIWIPAKPTD